MNADCDDDLKFCLTSRFHCVECLANPDCPSLADVCDAVTRTCAPACSTSTQCTDEERPHCAPRGICVSCLADGDCEDDGDRCDPTSNVCRKCLVDADCSDGKRCQAGECEEPTP